MYTFHWFQEDAIENFSKFFYPLRKKKKPIIGLEIGCFEGMSTAWLLTHICRRQRDILYVIDHFNGSKEHRDSNSPYLYPDLSLLYKRFLKNVNFGRKRLRIFKLDSINALPKILSEALEKKFLFDFIYIDGSHKTIDVLRDGLLCWYLLAENGIIIFDDYLYHSTGKFESPKRAIDFLILLFRNENPNIDIYKGYQVVIKKISN